MRERIAHRHQAHTAALKLERWHRWSIYLTFAGLVGSGAMWLIAHYTLRVVNEFGSAPHPLEAWSMKCHGAAAMLSLFLIGSMLHLHIRRGLKQRRRLAWPLTLLFLCAMLATTGFGLYYLVNEDSRPIWSAAHWLPGLMLPLAFIAHIAVGRAARANTDA